MRSKPSWPPQRDPHCERIAPWPKPPRLNEASTVTDIKVYLADEAKRITSGARRAAYGPPEDNFGRTARLWNAHLENLGHKPVCDAVLVATFMRLMKEARLAETPDHLDSFTDILGYAMCGAEAAGVKVPQP